MKYRHIACGGTFDFFHAGHREFLKKALLLSRHVSVGVTSDRFANSLGKYPSSSFSVRKSAIKNYLNEHRLLKRVSLLKLDDVFGTTVTDGTLQGILATENSLSGATKINSARRDLKQKLLDVIICKLINADDGLPISSTRIKAGEISTDGLNYFKLLKKNDYALPKKLRTELGRPFGEIVQKITQVDKPKLIITVGDQTTMDCLRIGITPNVSIVDYKVQRIRAFETHLDLGFGSDIKVFRAENPQGYISKNLSTVVHKSVHDKDKSVVVVSGEEDLAVLPAVLLSGLGTNLYYGLRNQGLVKIVVDIDCKNTFLALLGKFYLR